MLLAALLLSAPATIACPAPTIGFAPPLDRPLLLERRIERELREGRFRQQIRYRLRFARAGRGFRLTVEQIALASDGPPELLRLLALQEESSAGETLEVTLDATGAILGISESPGAPERLAAALARLRTDPGVATRDAAEQAQIGAMLDRLAALTPDERAAIHQAKIERLVMFAGRPCAQAMVSTRDRARYRLTAAAGDSWELETVPGPSPDRLDAAQGTDRAVLSTATGLVLRFERQTVVRVAGTERKALESLTVSTDAGPPQP